jgi:hypothetical protein
VARDTDELIPIRSFGHCRWCGEEGAKLQYLMCTNCFNIAGMMPSKVTVVMNQPDVKKSLEKKGINIRTITPMLVRFLLNPKNKFPPGIQAKEHWDQMLDECVEYVNEDEIAEVYDELKKERRRQGGPPPDEDEIAEIIGMEGTIRYFLLYCVIRGLLKIEMTDEEREELERIREAVMANATLETSIQQTVKPILEERSKPKSIGMNIKKRV